MERWFKAQNSVVDLLEVESVVLTQKTKDGYVDKNGKWHDKVYKVWQVGIVGRSGKRYLVAEFRDKQEAEAFRDKLATQVKNVKEQYFNDTWGRLVGSISSAITEVACGCAGEV